MIFGLLVIGLALIASSLKGTQHELAQQLQTDLIGPSGFLPWIGAILAIGAIGYIPGLRTTSRYLLVLLGVVIIVRNGGVWAQAQSAILAASQAGPAPSTPPAPITTGGTSGGTSTSQSGGTQSGGGGSDAQLASSVAIAALALA